MFEIIAVYFCKLRPDLKQLATSKKISRNKKLFRSNEGDADKKTTQKPNTLNSQYHGQCPRAGLMDRVISQEMEQKTLPPSHCSKLR